MDLNAKINVAFARVDVNFANFRCDQILFFFFFHFDTNEH